MYSRVNEKWMLIQTIRSGVVIPIVLLFVCCSQFATYIYHFEPIKELPSETLLVTWFTQLMDLKWVAPIVNTTAILLSCVLLARMDSENRLYNTKSNLCYFVYAVVISTNITTVSSDFLPLYNLTLLLSLVALFEGYNLKSRYLHLVFNIFCLFSLLSIIDFDALLYIPLLIYGVIRMRIMSKKTLMAIAVGVLLPYLFYLFWCFYTNDYSTINPIFTSQFKINIIEIESIQPYEWVHFTVTTLLLVPALMNSITANRFTRIKTRIVITFLLFFLLTSGLFLIFNPGKNSMPLGFYNLVASFFIGRYFTSDVTSAKNNLFVVAITIYFVILFWSLWLS